MSIYKTKHYTLADQIIAPSSDHINQRTTHNLRPVRLGLSPKILHGMRDTGCELVTYNAPTFLALLRLQASVSFDILALTGILGHVRTNYFLT